MKIFGWAADNAGPGFYRLRVPLDEVARQTEHTVEVNTKMPDWVLEEADVVIGQRVAQPRAADRWRRMATGVYGHRPLMVFEIDDDLWDIDPANLPAWNFFARQPDILANMRDCAALADVCTVSTEPLAEVVRQINPNVVVLPNQLPASAFDAHALQDTGSPHYIGWGGGASHALDVAEMTYGLHSHFRRQPRDVFVNLGTLFPSVAKAVGASLASYSWTDDMTEHYHRLSSLDIGLAPLRPSRFNQSKSEIKFLEYAAAGAATIATRHGPYERVIEHEQTGLLCRSEHEWNGALTALTTDPTLRIELAANALAYARTRAIDQHWQSWEKVYAEG